MKCTRSSTCAPFARRHSRRAKIAGMATTLGALTIALTLAGCVTTQQQADGSTKVHLSLGAPVKINQEIENMRASLAASQFGSRLNLLTLR